MVGLGTLILIAIVVIGFRRGGAMMALLGLCLGVIVAGTSGPLADMTDAILGAVQALLDAITNLIGGSGTPKHR